MKLNKNINYILGAVGLIPFIAWVYMHINIDIWYDEVFSFENFVLVNWKDIIFNYPLPNNHIFFDIISKIISITFNLRNIFSIAEHVYVFRSFQALIALATAYYSSLIIKRFFNREFFYLINVILFTCIPFLNFSLQLRGYNLSSLLLITIIYYSWTYAENPQKKTRNILIFSTFGLLYTIPSNLYFLIAFGISILYNWHMSLRDAQRNTMYSLAYKRILIFISIGLCIATIAYFPVLKNVIFNDYSSKPAPYPLYSFVLFIKIIPDFFSKKYLLLFFLLPGIFLFSKHKKDTAKFISLLFLLMFSFIISFFHQKAPFDRVFVVLSPIFCILITILLLNTVIWLKQRKIILSSCLTFIVIYCLITFKQELKINEQLATKDMTQNNIIDQNIYTNYYLETFFHPNESMKKLSLLNDKKSQIVLFEQIDHPSMVLYIRKNNMSFVNVESFSDLILYIHNLKCKKVYIITSFLKKNLELLNNQHNLKINLISKENSFANIIECEKI